MKPSGFRERGDGITSSLYERRLDDGDISALGRLIGPERPRFAADAIEIELPSGLMSCRSLAFPLSGDQSAFVNITSDWIQIPYDDFHLLKAVITPVPEGITVSPIAGREANSVGPCSWIELSDFGPLRCIEIVSYEIDDEVTRGDDGPVIAHEIVRYDRALRLRFAGGRVLTLSTQHGSILGAIEIRSGEDIGNVEPHARIEIRHTLN
ncbi:MULTISPECIES: hypothetical protein [Methylobacterium]|jgi:hypothetical protein|uniref:hypothetical protein n=1 Tax=Methylobacterium TaxID=407 RepID=UPI0008E9790B|nr:MULTISPECIES: hypothetical protein [Methylobacterium]MBZ6414331.1 hypothetical protein [Methylobacterium sp.]MBK3398973.1 hypothetical protein [Methylobacterium ajmalii]MBK3408190.1 hypothetical protein [Methylobacterium ajmalii]MBK3422918.1 hypothetical protein [Methylobacterium ajmalii]SFF72992.1 hypothetical protein SAMN04487844_14312 [Methylobacterium sp. yr596]